MDSHGYNIRTEPAEVNLLAVFKQRFSEFDFAWNFWLIEPEGSWDDLMHVLKLHLKLESAA